MALTDTTPEASRRQAEYYRSLTGSERVRLAMAMAEEVKAVALAGIRARQPGLSSSELHAAWIRLLHGDDVARRLDEAGRQDRRET